MGRGTAEGGGGVTWLRIILGHPSTTLRVVPLPVASRQGGKFIPCLPAKAQAFLMKLLKKLTNPFILVAEGFLVGALLFATATPDLAESRTAPPPALDSSVIPNSAR